MNQFTNLTAMFIKAMFKEDAPNIPDGKFPEGSEPYLIMTRMRQLVEEKKINTAENMLFDVFDKQKPYYVRIALEFYNRISQLSDEELEAADFSVEEIGEGIKDMFDFYGIKVAVKKGPPPSEAGGAQTQAAARPNPAKSGPIPVRPGMPNPAMMKNAAHPAPNVLADKKPGVAPNVLADKKSGKN